MNTVIRRRLNGSGQGNVRPLTSIRNLGILLVAIMLAATEFVVSLQDTQMSAHHLSLVDWLVAIAVLMPSLSFSAVGVFVVTRRPGNRVGWLMILIGVGYCLGSLTADYPGFAPVTQTPTRPFGLLIAWVSTWIWVLYLLDLFWLFLLFPNGRLASPRWKPILFAGTTLWILAALMQAFTKGPIDEQSWSYSGGASNIVSNPVGVLPFSQDLANAFIAPGFAVLAAAMLSLILRFRRSRGDERQQLKWFTYATAIAFAFVLLAFGTGWSNVFAIFAVLALTGVPVFICIAILKYRLYDIDVLVRRTLVYTTLSVALVLVYVVQVFVLQEAFRLVIHQQSGIVVAIATLGMVAAFQPLRHRIQRLIDKRFYRRRYDAARVIQEFQTRLGSQVTHETITNELTSVVQETLQPISVQVWDRRQGLIER